MGLPDGSREIQCDTRQIAPSFCVGGESFAHGAIEGARDTTTRDMQETLREIEDPGADRIDEAIRTSPRTGQSAIGGDCERVLVFQVGSLRWMYSLQVYSRTCLEFVGGCEPVTSRAS
jgi:hypothetical protein